MYLVSKESNRKLVNIINKLSSDWKKLTPDAGRQTPDAGRQTPDKFVSDKLRLTIVSGANKAKCCEKVQNNLL